MLAEERIERPHSGEIGEVSEQTKTVALTLLGMELETDDIFAFDHGSNRTTVVEGSDYEIGGRIGEDETLHKIESRIGAETIRESA
jgi:hypothetical protein